MKAAAPVYHRLWTFTRPKSVTSHTLEMAPARREWG
jgi:hypothetical protein